MHGITYIIATHNRHELLERAIVSIAVESSLIGYYPTELIVVDDSSQPPVVIKEEWHLYFEDGIQLIQNPTNQQVSRSRNIGLQKSRYEYVIFLDDDDISHPNRSATLLTAIQNTEYSFVTAKSIMKSGNEEKAVPIGGEMELDPVTYLAQFAHINAVIWNKEHLMAVGGMDETNPYFGEHIAALKLLLDGKTALQIEETVTEFEYNDSGLTNEALQHNKLAGNLLQLYQQLEPLAIHHPQFQSVSKKIQEQLLHTPPATFDEYLRLITQTPAV